MESLASISAQLIEQLDPADIRAARRRVQHKAALVMVGFLASYGLVITGHRWALGIGLVGVALSSYSTISVVMHDANHGAMFDRPSMNRLVGYSLDFFGASSLMWCIKHNDVHHHHANVDEVDADIRQQPFFRLNHYQQWHVWHRFQHLYAPVLYGFLPVQFVFADFYNLFRSSIRDYEITERPSPLQIAGMLLGKLVFLTWALLLPVYLYGLRAAVVALAVAWVVGVALALTVQVAHVVDIVEHYEFSNDTPSDRFVRHQASVTADVATKGPLGRVFRWLAGGLDKQVAHHLVPSLPHTIYPQLQQKVEDICANHGAKYRTHPSMTAAIRSHFRWLHELGRRPAAL